MRLISRETKSPTLGRGFPSQSLLFGNCCGCRDEEETKTKADNLLRPAGWGDLHRINIVGIIKNGISLLLKSFAVFLVELCLLLDDLYFAGHLLLGHHLLFIHHAAWFNVAVSVVRDHRLLHHSYEVHLHLHFQVKQVSTKIVSQLNFEKLFYVKLLFTETCWPKALDSFAPRCSACLSSCLWSFRRKMRQIVALEGSTRLSHKLLELSSR